MARGYIQIIIRNEPIGFYVYVERDFADIGQALGKSVAKLVDLGRLYERPTAIGSLLGARRPREQAMKQPGERRRISVPPKVAVKIRLAVVQEFTSWYHQKGTPKNRTIALMQEPDSDTYVSNSGLNRSSSSITQTPAGTRALLTLTEADRRKTK